MYTVIRSSENIGISIPDCVATPETWQFQKGNLDYVGWEKYPFTQIEIDLIESKGGVIFSTSLEFQEWISQENDIERIEL